MLGTVIPQNICFTCNTALSTAGAGCVGNTAAALGDTINKRVSNFVIDSYQVPF